MNKQPILWASAAALVLASGSVLAESYQMEAGAGFGYWDPDNLDSNYDYGVRGSYYLAPVNTGGHPLAESAFLERASGIHGDYTRGDNGFDSMHLAGEVYVPGTVFYARAGVSYSPDVSGDSTYVRGALGVTPIDGLRIATNVTEDSYDPNINAKYVTALGGGNFLNVQVSYIDTDWDDAYSVGADFYFDRTLSVGASYADVSGDPVTLRVRKFFTPSFAIAVSLTDRDYANSGTIEASLRF